MKMEDDGGRDDETKLANRAALPILPSAIAAPHSSDAGLCRWHSHLHFTTYTYIRATRKRHNDALSANCTVTTFEFGDSTDFQECIQIALVKWCAGSWLMRSDPNTFWRRCSSVNLRVWHPDTALSRPSSRLQSGSALPLSDSRHFLSFHTAMHIL